MMYHQVRLTILTPEGQTVARNFGHLFDDEEKAETFAFKILGMSTEVGPVVSSQVWTTGDDARLLNEFEA